MLAFPYERSHASQWNVDQAAALILVSAGVATGAGAASDGFLFPHSGWESNHMVPVTARATMHRCPALRLAADAVDVDSIEHLDIYSCYPSAVRIQERELRIGPDRQLTVTGGMAHAGGPLNNYVLQATARMAAVLRDDADVASRGLVTAVSGMLTKQGYTVWGTSPPKPGFSHVDVTKEAHDVTGTVDVRAEPPPDGTGTIVSYTGLYERGADAPHVGFVVADVGDGTRSIVRTGDEALLDAMCTDELIGEKIDFA